MSTAPFGSITDVAGVRVGHHQRAGRGWQTGTTVVFVPDGATPGVSVRGGGPGTRETDALRPENLVELIHAVCLTGGSAFGLAAADGVVGWLEEQRLGFPVGPPSNAAVEPVGVVPVVPAAVVFDLGRGGDFANRPDAQFGKRAVERAHGRHGAQGSWGSVGAGTGARAGGLQGGVGTAGTIVTIAGDIIGTPGVDAHVSVGAVAVVNANGSPIDPSSGLPWTHLAPVAGLVLRLPSTADRARLRAALDGQSAGETSLNTTIGVVATSATLTKSEVSKMADVAHDGLARAVRPAHSMFDGDTVFGLATGTVDLGHGPAAMRSPASRQRAVNQLLTAAADTFELACVHAVIAAERRGALASYADLCPSAFRL